MLLWFNEIGATDIDTVGGKGANLGEMTKAGFSVPNGFCIVADAYKQHIKLSNLWPQIQSLLSRINSDNVLELDKMAEQIRSLIEEAPMEVQIKIQIQTAYRRLTNNGDARVAVRSSATAEDLPEASFAGQQETYLSVFGEDEVLKYVQKCWASLWTGRSIAYRKRNGFEHKNVALAVVIQKMVEAEKSGVLFTVNPLTGDRDEMLVNASYGLGESIVSGRVTPDSYRISKNLAQLITEQQLGTKETQIKSEKNGLTIEEAVSEQERYNFCMNKWELLKLLKLGKKIEEYYKLPQDIEWAFVGECLYLIQTRPITVINTSNALHENEIRRLSKEEQVILDDWKEHVPDAPYPLEYGTLIQLSEMKNSVYHDLGISMPSPEKTVMMNENGVIAFRKLLARPNIRLIWVPLNIRRLLLINSARTSAKYEEQLDLILKGIEGIKTESLNKEQLGQYIEKSINLAMEYGRIRFKVYIFPMVIRGKWLKILLRLARVSKELNQFDLLTGLDQKTALIEKSMYDLAEYASTLPYVSKVLTRQTSENVIDELKCSEEGIIFLDRMKGFLNENGARTMKSLLLFSNLSWEEDPVLFLASLSTILRSGNIKNQRNKIFRAGEKHISTKEDIVHRLPTFFKSTFLKTHKRFREDCIGREKLLYDIEKCYVVVRKGVQDASRRLEECGYIQCQDDVKYLTLSELYKVLKGNMQNQVKKNLINRKLHRINAEMIWNGPTLEEEGDNTNILRGISSSPGIAKGRVCVISGSSEFFKLQRDDILVCMFTDPAWTPLFSLAAAVVSDTGGPLSHAAIVAREYSIPAVLGTKVATSRLKDGDIVIVDGLKGIVSLCK